jgi:hypothetical protein
MKRTEAKRVKRYNLRIGSTESRISLFRDDDEDHLVAELVFTEDGMPSQGGQGNGGQGNGGQGGQTPEITLPLSQYMAVVDMLRHEGPLHFLPGDEFIETQNLEKIGQDES